MRVADFFCGGGGFSEGFRQAGFEIVFAVDKWAPAVNTYKGNKPGANVIQDDVIRISNLPDDEFEALVPDSEVIDSIDSVEWRNQQYDTIFCTNVLSAVPYYIERLQILKNAKSVLKDSGVLFISTQYRNSYFNTYNERADIQRFIDGWLIPRTNKKYCFYAPITENALSELCVDAGQQIKKVFKHDGSCFIIAAKPVDGVQW